MGLEGVGVLDGLDVSGEELPEVNARSTQRERVTPRGGGFTEWIIEPRLQS